MKHPIRIGRVFADMEATDDQGELYDLTIIRHGKADEHREAWFQNVLEANSEALRLSADGCVVILRPASEMVWSAA